jgi:hypothetical protein
MSNSSVMRLLAKRQGEVSEWLENESPYTMFDQKHLESGTSEQAYWHFGYVSAINDVMRLLSETSASEGNSHSSH